MKVFKYLVIYMFIFQSVAISFTASANDLPFPNPFADVTGLPELENNYNDMLDNGDLDALTEEELIFATVARDMKRSYELCKEAGGAAGFKLGVIDDPLVKAADGSAKKINCNQVAKFMFDLQAGSGDPDVHNPAFSCLTSGWDYDTKLDFYREFMDDIEKVGFEAEKEFKCPGKSESMSTCMASLACNAMSVAIPVVGQLLQSPLVDGYLTGGNGCSKYGNTGGQNCFTNLLWGAWKSIVGNIEGIYDLLGLGWDALKGIGKAAWEGGKKAGRAVWNFATPDSWNIPDPEDKARMGMHAIEQQSDGFFSRFLKDPMGTIQGFASNFMGGIVKMVQDGAVNNFGCMKFPSPQPVAGSQALGLVTGKVKCEGEDRWVSSECATCNQWMNVACGVGGFLGGEVINSLLMGKAFSYIGKGIKFAGAADDVTKAAIKMADATGDTSKLTRSMKLRKGIGEGADWLVKHLGKSPTLKLAKIAGGAVIKGVTVMAEMAGGLFKVIAIELPGGIIKKALMYGGKIVGMTDDKIAQMMKYIHKGAGGLKNAALALPKGYLKMMDDAFVLGFQGKAGLKMLRNSRNIEKISESSKMLKGLEGADEFADVAKLHDEAMDSLRAYESVAKQAKRAQESGNIEEFTRLMTKLDDLQKTHKTKIALATSKAEDARLTLKARAEVAAMNKSKKADNVADVTGNPGATTVVANSVDNSAGVVTKVDDIDDVVDVVKIEKLDDGTPVLRTDRGTGRGTSSVRGSKSYTRSTPSNKRLSQAFDSDSAKALNMTEDQKSLISAYANSMDDVTKRNEMIKSIKNGEFDGVVRRACK